MLTPFANTQSINTDAILALRIQEALGRVNIGYERIEWPNSLLEPGEEENFNSPAERKREIPIRAWLRDFLTNIIGEALSGVSTILSAASLMDAERLLEQYGCIAAGADTEVPDYRQWLTRAEGTTLSSLMIEDGATFGDILILFEKVWGELPNKPDLQLSTGDDSLAYAKALANIAFSTIVEDGIRCALLSYGAIGDMLQFKGAVVTLAALLQSLSNME